MTEIELKVHVEDRDTLIEKLNTFATYTTGKRLHSKYMWSLSKLDKKLIGKR